MVEAKPTNILLCYKFSDYNLTPQVKELMESKSLTNADYKAAMNEMPFIISLKGLLEDEAGHLDVIALKTIIMTAFSDAVKEGNNAADSYVSMIVFLMATYARENCLGPSVYTEYV